MNEIIRVAKDERIIIICTIHQPSTKVYNSFDQVMILSKGREAFTGDVKDATPYFDSIGYPLPVQTNPAGEFLFDLHIFNVSLSSGTNAPLLSLLISLLITTEHFLDLVNADFSDDAEVDKILDTWEEKRPDAGSSHHKKGFDEDEEQTGVSDLVRAPLRREIAIMFRRCAVNIVRDPILYIGRAFVFLMANSIFALVYLKAREFSQDQALNKMWISIW